jgi:O-antigen ligase
MSAAPQYGITKILSLVFSTLIPLSTLVLMAPLSTQDIRTICMTITVASILLAVPTIVIGPIPVAELQATLAANRISISRAIGAGAVVLALYIFTAQLPERSRAVRVCLLPCAVAILMILFAAMMMNGSRGPVVATVLAVALVMLGRAGLGAKVRFAVAAGTVIVIMATSIDFEYWAERIPGFERIHTGIAGFGEQRTDIARMQSIDVALDAMYTSSFVGVGTGGFASLAAATDTRSYPHNVLLEITVEQGAAGAAAFLILVGTSIRRAWRLVRTPGPEGKALAALFVHGLANAMVSGDVTSNQSLWICAGLLWWYAPVEACRRYSGAGAGEDDDPRRANPQGLLLGRATARSPARGDSVSSAPINPSATTPEAVMDPTGPFSPLPTTENRRGRGGLRILYITLGNIDDRTGAGEHIRGMIRGLAECGHEVTVVAYVGSCDEHPVGENIRYHLFGPHRRLVIKALRLRRAIAEVLRAGHFDFAYLRTFPTDYITVCTSLLRHSVPYACEMNTVFAGEYRARGQAWKARYYAPLERLTLIHSTIWLPVTHEIRDHAERLSGTTRPWLIARNGIDFVSERDVTNRHELRRRANRGGDEVILIMLGMDRPWHGADRAIALLSYLPPRYRLWLVGSRTMSAEARLREIAKTHRVEDRFEIHRWCSGTELGRRVACADIALGPLALDRKGMTEAQPIKIAYYLDYGIPVVTNYVDLRLSVGQRFVLHRLTTDMADLAAAIVAWDWSGDDVRREAQAYVRERLAWKGIAAEFTSAAWSILRDVPVRDVAADAQGGGPSPARERGCDRLGPDVGPLRDCHRLPEGRDEQAHRDLVDRPQCAGTWQG